MEMRSGLFVAVAFVGLTLASLARAEHEEQYDQRYGGRWLERVQVLAHQVEDAAEHFNEAAQRGRHHGGWREYAALRRMEVLEDQARHFHRQVESRRQDPRHAEADFRALLRAYQRAAYAIHDLHAYEHVRRDFGRVAYLVSQLNAAYGGYGYGYRHGYDRDEYRGHYGKDRYDDDGYDDDEDGDYEDRRR